MKDVVNFLFLGQFELVSLFAYRVKHSKKTEKLGFLLAIPLGFEVFAIQPDLVAWGKASWLDIFIVGSLLKFLGVVEVLLAHVYQLSELGK